KRRTTADRIPAQSPPSRQLPQAQVASQLPAIPCRSRLERGSAPADLGSPHGQPTAVPALLRHGGVQISIALPDSALPPAEPVESSVTSPNTGLKHDRSALRRERRNWKLRSLFALSRRPGPYRY